MLARIRLVGGRSMRCEGRRLPQENNESPASTNTSSIRSGMRPAIRLAAKTGRSPSVDATFRQSSDRSLVTRIENPVGPAKRSLHSGRYFTIADIDLQHLATTGIGSRAGDT